MTFSVLDDKAERLIFQRFYPKWITDDLDPTEITRLEKNVEKVILPSVSDHRPVESVVVRDIGSFRVTYSSTQGEPSRKELHSVIEAFEESGRSKATVILRQSRSIALEDGPTIAQDESIEFFIERLGAT